MYVSVWRKKERKKDRVFVIYSIVPNKSIIFPGDCVFYL